MLPSIAHKSLIMLILSHTDMSFQKRREYCKTKRCGELSCVAVKCNIFIFVTKNYLISFSNHDKLTQFSNRLCG